MALTRRELLAAGAAALVPAAGPADPMAPKPPHFAPRARSVIFLLHHGGLSQMDSFDPKPALERHHGKKLTAEVLPGVGAIRAYFGGNEQPLMRSPFKFARHGGCGKAVSDLFPHLAECVDDMAFVHSVYSDINNHAPALFQINTGTIRQGFPSMGAWITYALGSENRDLPGAVVMAEGDSLPIGGPANWGSGFLPAAYQATFVRGGKTPILDLRPPPDLAPEAQRASLDLLDALNRRHAAARGGDDELEARMAAYELAFRMQARTPELMDLSAEDPKTLALYGIGAEGTDDLGRKCLLARRLVERGVRFVQIYSGSYQGGTDWDAHGNLASGHRRSARGCDRPFAALLKDLKRTGLASRVLVVCASEFGRLPISQGGDGRDHNPGAQTAWLFGAGIRGGVSVGATDEVGYRAVEDRAHVRDLHATILHLMGLDDLRLTYYFAGRQQRLTDNGGRVIGKALA